jgi:hypothetical protein
MNPALAAGGTILPPEAKASVFVANMYGLKPVPFKERNPRPLLQGEMAHVFSA